MPEPEFVKSSLLWDDCFFVFWKTKQMCLKRGPESGFRLVSLWSATLKETGSRTTHEVCLYRHLSKQVSPQNDWLPFYLPFKPMGGFQKHE